MKAGDREHREGKGGGTVSKKKVRVSGENKSFLL